MHRPGHGKKVVVAMSGGVDSSVAAALLLEQGYAVVGCFLRLGDADSDHGPCGPDPLAGATGAGPARHQGCCSANDAADARLVAALLDIPFYVLNFHADFERVIRYFVDEYNQGRTPNPCVRCNSWLKLGRLVHYARSIDAQYVATGHYARVEQRRGRARLLRARDARKDQSYVLFATTPRQLDHLLLPIGAYEKAQVRRIAEQRKLPVHAKPDSQEICFVPDNDYFGLIQRRSPERVRPGVVVDSVGRVVGEHGGHQRFTVGQRRGLSVSLGHPVYVIDKDAGTNTIRVGSARRVLARGLVADQTNWLIDPPARPLPCRARIRSNGPRARATVRATGPDTLEVRFERRQRAISPGQAVVCYDGDEVLGGGWIRHVLHR